MVAWIVVDGVVGEEETSVEREPFLRVEAFGGAWQWGEREVRRSGSWEVDLGKGETRRFSVTRWSAYQRTPQLSHFILTAMQHLLLRAYFRGWWIVLVRRHLVIGRYWV